MCDIGGMDEMQIVYRQKLPWIGYESLGLYSCQVECCPYSTIGLQLGIVGCCASVS